MAGYKYDDEGGQFLTFVLTFLCLVLLPLTYSILPSTSGRSLLNQTQGWFDKRGQKDAFVKKINRRSPLRAILSGKLIFVSLGWLWAAYLVQTIANTSSNSAHAVYNPFEILGIPTNQLFSPRNIESRPMFRTAV